MKTLVDLAMMSTDESDIQTDRVSCLHTTALGFAPFIFDLANKHADFEQLMEMCSGVWEEVKRNETLPVKLVRYLHDDSIAEKFILKVLKFFRTSHSGCMKDFT